MHDLALYKDDRPVGMAEFREVHITEAMSQNDLFLEMDKPSQEISDLSVGIVETHLRLLGDDEFFWEGWRYVEFARLVVLPGEMAPSTWASLVNQFILTQFRNTRNGKYQAMLLCPFPLEFESRCSDENTAQACDRRRQAMVRFYSRMLGVELVSDEGDEKWWMARELPG